MRFRGIFIIFIILFSSLISAGQQVSYVGIEQGLSNNTVTAIYKDRFGLMWFGTLDGLNRYDGYSFKSFRNKYGDTTSLPNDIINSVNADKLGNIWVATEKGPAVLDNKTLLFSNIYYINNNKRLLFDKWTNAVKSDAAGNIYIGANNIGFSIAPNGSKTVIPIPLIINSKKTTEYTVTAIDVDKYGIWAMVDNIGLCSYNTKSRSLISIKGDFFSASCIKADNNDNLWVGTQNGLFHYNIRSKVTGRLNLKNKALNHCKIKDLILDKKNNLWIATDGEGVIELNKDTTKYNVLTQAGNSTLSSDAIYTIYEDDLSRKWIGTLRGGINIIDDKKNQFKTYRHIPYNPNSLVYNFTFSFCEDNNKNIWIGTDGGGISVWNRRSNIFKNYTKSDQKVGLNSNYITGIIKDNGQNIWISTFGGGVSKFNSDNDQFENIPFQNKGVANSAWSLYKDQKGDIWVTCLRGLNPSNFNNRLFKYNFTKNAFLPAPFPVTADIVSIIDDGPDNLWMGNFTGLVHADKNKGINKVINLNSAVRSLYKSRSGLLWIGTYGRGLFAYNEVTGRLHDYTENDGLCNNKVLNIQEDARGNIWVSTYNGISKLNPKNAKFENFYAADGLQSNQFYYNASAHLSTGELIFGGIKGFNIFYPDSIKQYHDFPPLVISGLRIANTAVNVNNDFFPGAKNFYNIDRIKLPYDKAIISLDYVALEYSLPEKIQYAYFLQGRDKSWNYVNNQRSINYSQLNEGHYILKIRSTNASGIWNAKEKVIDIIISPPWYRSWWAYILYVAGIITSIYGYLFYHKKQTQLQYEVKFVKELNEKKIAFFTNISHELRTPLTLIVNPIKDLLHSNGVNLDLVDISSVYRNSRRLLSLVDQLLLFRSSENEISDLQPSWLNLKDVCYEVFLCFNNQVKAKGLDYQFNCSLNEFEVFADREKLEIVLFNLLSNAIKYTPETGTVTLTIQESEQFAEILITDNGRGIPAETGEKLFEKFYRLQQDNEIVTESGFGIGLFLARKYMDLHKGSLTYTSKIGAGTTFKILLPKVDKKVSSDTHLPHLNLTSGTFPLLKELIADYNENVLVGKGLSNKHVDEILDVIISKKPVILLIDDDVEVRAYIKHLLIDDYIVYEADNTEAGLKIVQEYEPEIIVCDVVMKGMSGVEFCSKIKDSPAFSHIPVILLTGSSSPEIKLKGIECGADDYITKPFENELLVARIKSMLKGRDTLKNYFFNEITLKNNSLKIPAEYSEFLSKCMAIVEKHLEDETFSLKTFTDEIGMSRSKLFRKIKSISGLSSTEFIRHIRLRKAAELMIQTDLQIKEIAYKIGFQDIKYFREQFNKLFEMNPSEFIRKYRKTFMINHKLNDSILQRNKN